MKKIISGFALHVHHNILMEWCYDYKERVRAIKQDKPFDEQKTRLRLFKMLSPKALEEFPRGLNKVRAELSKARAKRDKTRAKWDKTRSESYKTRAEWDKACAEWYKACAEWYKACDELDKACAENAEVIIALHSKYCGCKEWNGTKIIFPKAAK